MPSLEHDPMDATITPGYPVGSRGQSVRRGMSKVVHIEMASDVDAPLAMTFGMTARRGEGA